MGDAASEPLISVIVPVYKVEPYLRKCVDSILAQTHTNLEIILVDDGSPDGCPAICDEYAQKDPRIIVIHKENGGPSSARNAGIDISTGDWLTFIDSDDRVSEDYIQTLLLAAGSNTIICSGIVYVSAAGDLISQKIPSCPDLPSLVKDGLFGYSVCKLYARAILENKRFPNTLREDLIFNLSLLNSPAMARYGTISYAGYHYRQLSSSLLHSSAPWPAEQICHTIHTIHDTLADTPIPQSEKIQLFNMITYVFVSDAFSRNFICGINMNDVRQILGSIPRGTLKIQYANNSIFKATWFANKFRLVRPYVWLLKKVYGNKHE